MAYVVDYALTYAAAAGTNVAANMPAHEANDILVVWCNMNSGSMTGATGWTAIANNTTNAANTSSWTWKRATTSTETLTFTTADDYSMIIVCIRDVDTTTALDVAASLGGSATSTSTPTSPTVTPATNDALILYFMSLSGIANAVHSNPGFHHIVSMDNGGTNDANSATCAAAAWYIQRASGQAAPACTWTASLAGTQTYLTIALRNKASGIIPAYIDDVATNATVVTPGHHYSTLNNISFTTTLTSTAAINGKTVTGLTGAAQADLGINPFSSGLGVAASTIARTALQGYQLSLTGNRNWSTGLIMGSFIGGTPKMGTFGMGTVSDGGVVVRIGSSATAWCAYQVAAKDSIPNLEVRSVWAIEPGYTATAYGTPGTSVTTTAVSHIQFLQNSPYFNSHAILSEVYQVFKIIVAGGTSTNPVDSTGLSEVGKSFRLPVIQKAGGAGVISYAPIQIGGGDAVNFQIDAGALQFPRRYNTTSKEISFHVSDNKVGISYAGKSGDVIKHTNSVITSLTPYYWEINSAATSAATWDFSGLTVVNATVTTRPVTTFTDMSFSKCSSITTNAASFSSTSFTGCAEFAAAGASFSECVFAQGSSSTGVVSITGATQTALQTELNKFTSCSFTNNVTPVGALRIIFTGAGGSPITLDLNNTLFSGNTKDIRWEAPTSTNLIINKLGTTNGSTFSATNSNTVSFQVSATLQITGLVNGSDIVILNAGTSTERVNVDSNSGTTYNYAYTTTGSIDICVYKKGYLPYIVRDYSLTAGGGTLPVKQVIDRNYKE